MLIQPLRLAYVILRSQAGIKRGSMGAAAVMAIAEVGCVDKIAAAEIEPIEEGVAQEIRVMQVFASLLLQQVGIHQKPDHAVTPIDRSFVVAAIFGHIRQRLGEVVTRAQRPLRRLGQFVLQGISRECQSAVADPVVILPVCRAPPAPFCIQRELIQLPPLPSQLVAQRLAFGWRQAVFEPVVAQAQPEEQPGRVQIMIGHALLAPMRIANGDLDPGTRAIQVCAVLREQERQAQIQDSRADIGDGIAGVFCWRKLVMMRIGLTQQTPVLGARDWSPPGAATRPANGASAADLETGMQSCL